MNRMSCLLLPGSLAHCFARLCLLVSLNSHPREAHCVKYSDFNIAPAAYGFTGTVGSVAAGEVETGYSARIRLVKADSHTQPNATATYNMIIVHAAPMAAMLAAIAAKKKLPVIKPRKPTCPNMKWSRPCQLIVSG